MTHAFKDNRSGYSSETKPETKSKGNGSRKSTVQDDYHAMKNYSNAEDFSDEWEDEFEDYDDVYEYYEEETGHY